MFASEGNCTFTPSIHLCSRHASALTYPLSACPLQEHVVSSSLPLSGILVHLHLSADNCTCVPSATLWPLHTSEFVSKDKCTHMPTATLWPLHYMQTHAQYHPLDTQAPALTSPLTLLLPTGTCTYIPSVSLTSVVACTHMTNPALWPLWTFVLT